MVPPVGGAIGAAVAATTFIVDQATASGRAAAIDELQEEAKKQKDATDAEVSAYRLGGGASERLRANKF